MSEFNHTVFKPDLGKFEILRAHLIPLSFVESQLSFGHSRKRRNPRVNIFATGELNCR